MLKIVNKKHYDNLVREVTNLAIESKDRELELARLERTVEYLQDNYRHILSENESMKQALMQKEKAIEHKKKEEVSTKIKSYDKDSYIKEYMQNYRSGCV